MGMGTHKDRLQAKQEADKEEAELKEALEAQKAAEAENAAVKTEGETEGRKFNIKGVPLNQWTKKRIDDINANMLIFCVVREGRF